MQRESTSLSTLLACILSVSFTAAAQDGRLEIAESRPVGAYSGVAPGSAAAPPRLGNARGGRQTLLTWPGFQALANGGSRFFLQFSAAPVTDVTTTDGRVEVRVRNARVHVRNSLLPLDTSHFQGPVRSAQVERRGADLVVVFLMKTPSVPTVSTAPGENGFTFLYVDFQ